MGLAMQQAEFRRFPRRKISGDAYGRLFSKQRVGQYQVDFVDVSANGVGLTVFEPLMVGQEFTLVSGDETIDMRLVWIKYESAGIFRCGFILTKPHINLDLHLS